MQLALSAMARDVGTLGTLHYPFPQAPIVPSLVQLKAGAWWKGWVARGKMAVCQNLVPLVNIKIAGKWMFIPLKMVLIGIDPSPDVKTDSIN